MSTNAPGCGRSHQIVTIEPWLRDLGLTYGVAINHT